MIEQPASPVGTTMVDDALESSGLETDTLLQSPMDVDLAPSTPVKEAQQPEPGPSGSTRATTEPVTPRKRLLKHRVKVLSEKRSKEKRAYASKLKTLRKELAIYQQHQIKRLNQDRVRKKNAMIRKDSVIASLKDEIKKLKKGQSLLQNKS